MDLLWVKLDPKHCVGSLNRVCFLCGVAHGLTSKVVDFIAVASACMWGYTVRNATLFFLRTSWCHAKSYLKLQNWIVLKHMLKLLFNFYIVLLVMRPSKLDPIWTWTDKYIWKATFGNQKLYYSMHTFLSQNDGLSICSEFVCAN